MHNKKRGAIELSMTTIIVIVIGITLLSLGLVWIKNSFTSIEDLTRKAFENAKEGIGRINHEGEINVIPAEFTVEKGKYSTVSLYIANIGDEPISFKVKMIAPEGIDGGIAQTGKKRDKEYTSSKVQVGDELAVTLIIWPTDDAILGPIGIPIEISNSNWEEPKTVVATANIIKKSGIF